MAPSVERKFTITALLAPENSLNLGKVTNGISRMITGIGSGILQGEGLEAEILPNSGDWILVNEHLPFILLLACRQTNAEGVQTLDVRGQFRTKDGYGIYMSWTGIKTPDEATKRFMSGSPNAKSTEFSDYELFTHPVFETNHPDFKWIESAFFVGEARFLIEDGKMGVQHAIYQVRSTKKA